MAPNTSGENQNVVCQKNKQQTFEQLLSRKDYSSPQAKQDFVNQIYQWLCSLPADVGLASGLDFDLWRRDIKSQLGHLLVNTSDQYVQTGMDIPVPDAPVIPVLL